jgi:short-subunit dehydrogenase
MRRELEPEVHVLTVYPAGMDTEMNTADMRARCMEAGLETPPVLAPKDAAAQVMSALRRRKKRAVIGSRAERVMIPLVSRVPWLVDQVARRLRRALAVFGALATCRARERHNSQFRRKTAS